MTGPVSDDTLLKVAEKSTSKEIVAAGGLIVDGDASPVRILVIHRPEYDDWSLPKGKLEVGESPEQAAVREVREETGLECSIVRPISVARYTYTRERNGASKVVHYFLMKQVSGELRFDGHEVDATEWLTPEAAIARLSYQVDRDLIHQVLGAAAP